MVFTSEVRSTGTARAYPIETMRAVAVLMLVTYHVIGGDDGSGFALHYPHPLRMVADFLIDMRMPFFAFVAGYVYGLRPTTAGTYRRFIGGKFRRLYIPGMIAALLFAAFAGLSGTDSAVPPSEIWQIPFFPYVHFWFLQAVFVIFVLFGALDVVLQRRHTLLMLGLSVLMSLWLPYIPGNLMSVNEAVYLLPYVLPGLVCVRHQDHLSCLAPWLIVSSGLLMVAAIWWNILELHDSGHFSQDRRDLKSLAMGGGICLLGILTLPNLSFLERIGPFSFTIYLYHVFGTSGMRHLLHAAGIGNLSLHLVLGVIAGIGVPVILHLLASRTSMTRRIILGKKT